MSEFNLYLYIYKYIYKYRNIFWLLEGILRTATTATLQRIVASLIIMSDGHWCLCHLTLFILLITEVNGIIRIFVAVFKLRYGFFSSFNNN